MEPTKIRSLRESLQTSIIYPCFAEKLSSLLNQHRIQQVKLASYSGISPQMMVRVARGESVAIKSHANILKGVNKLLGVEAHNELLKAYLKDIHGRLGVDEVDLTAPASKMKDDMLNQIKESGNKNILAMSLILQELHSDELLRLQFYSLAQSVVDKKIRESHRSTLPEFLPRDYYLKTAKGERANTEYRDNNWLSS